MKEILNKILNISNKELNSINLSYSKFYTDINVIPLPPGKEHYRLIAYISTLFKNEILFDVGTNKCLSAIAMSYNKKNFIKSYDIKKYVNIYPILFNIEFVIGNVLEDYQLLESPFIFLDVDHDGKFEKEIYDYLKENKWKGLLLLDDIHLNDPMKLFWKNIKEEKWDITKKGHWSGTGIVLFE